MKSASDRVQTAYARLLVWLVRIGLSFIFAAFGLYALEIRPSAITLAEVPELWTLSADELSEAADVALGWSWVAGIADGRVLSFASLVVFPAGTIVLITIAVALYLRDRDRTYALVAALESVILIVAATGILSAGH